MSHVVLLGDSIFDNAAYVPGEPAVIEQLAESLPSGWTVELRAVDGSVTVDVARQLDGLHATTSHLVISSGGNDALRQVAQLKQPVHDVLSALAVLAPVQAVFARQFRLLMEQAAALGRTVTVCTVYEAVPGLPASLKTALSLYNDVIVRETLRAGFRIVDLREICTEPEDYSALSPIEPSSQGGRKIARAIREALDTDSVQP